MDSVNDLLWNFANLRSIGLYRYSTGVVERILGLLRRVEIEINSEINRADPGSGKVVRLAQMLKNIQNIIKEGNSLIQKRISNELGDLAVDEVEWSKLSLAASTKVRFNTVTPSADTLASLIDDKPFQGAYLSQWVDSFTTGQYERIRNAIQLGVSSGKTTPEIVRSLDGSAATRGRDGVFAQGRRSVDTMVRTAVSHVSSASREEWYAANPEIIKGVLWVSTLDNRTSSVCRGRDGKVFPFMEGPRPPAHPNCRSTTVPVIKSFRELGLDVNDFPEGTRASLNGQVPSTTTYPIWLKKQPPLIQDEILGPTRGKLFRTGEITLDRFTDPTGKSYTLRELRQHDAEAFRRAGL